MHELSKMRLEVHRRALRVKSKQYLTPRMLRVLFESDELQGFQSPSPDDHIKIFLPAADGASVMRDFTPRSWNLDLGTLTLEFALHEEGPAAEWARAAKPGDVLSIGGPRGSTVVEDDFDWYWLIGDASALPSIGRRLEELRPGVSANVLCLIDGDQEQQKLTTQTSLHVEWLNGSGELQHDASALCDAMRRFQVPEGDGFVWIACESSVARQLYQFASETLQLPRQWIKAAGYWTQGKSDTGERIG